MKVKNKSADSSIMAERRLSKIQFTAVHNTTHKNVILARERP
jgi:hypothetical protein